MSEPVAHTPETRAAAELEALKVELRGAEQRAGYELDELAQKSADIYVKDVKDAIAALEGKNKPKSGGTSATA